MQYAIGAGDGPLAWHYRGKRREQIGQYVMLVQEGDFVPTLACGDVDFQAWFIEPDLIRQAAEERGQSRAPCFVREVIADPKIYRLLIRSATILAHAKEALEQQETLIGFLDAILGEYVDNGRAICDVVAHRAVRRMRDLIQDGYDQKLSLDMLASEAHLNKFYALRAFKRAMGVTPHEYQRYVRLSKANQLLRAGHSSTEVAHAVGYCDQSHFVRTFRQMVLITPRQYQIGA